MKTLNSFRKISFCAAVILTIVFVTFPLEAFTKDDDCVETLRRMSKAFTQISEHASPAVVAIKAEKVASLDWPSTRNPFEDEFFDFFFGTPRRRKPQQPPRQTAQGSGFIISKEGYILTNNHLVGQASNVNVTLSDGRKLEAKIIGTDPESDVAVIKIEGTQFPYLELADSDELKVGEWVLAIGNPFGLSHTVTAGIVSAKGRSLGLTTYEDFIQTDAAINLGNSGGPSINLDGKVVGINTAIVSRGGGSMGIGLAIPINMAKSIYSQLIEGGTVVRGYLGIGPRDLTPEMAEYFGLEDSTGVIIAEVVPNSAADKAGLKRNDIILEFEGKPVTNADKFRKSVALVKPGEKVKLSVKRNGTRKMITAILEERSSAGRALTIPGETTGQLGLSVQDMTDDLSQRFGYSGMRGVIVMRVKPGSPAGQAGITAGMAVMEVNQNAVTNTEKFNNGIKKRKEEGAYLLLVNNGQYCQFILVTLPRK